MSKSTYIKDLKPTQQTQTATDIPAIRISEVKNEDSSDAEITLNEIIDEVSLPVDRAPQQIFRKPEEDTSTHSVPYNHTVFYKDAIAQREVTNQLQQQLIQQQLIQQQLLTNSMETRLGFGLGMISGIKKLFVREFIFIVGIGVLYILFQNFEVLSLLKIDRITAIQGIPFLKQIILTILLSVFSTVIKINV